MPDTLPDKWTWNSLPEWERSALQALIEPLEAAGFVVSLTTPTTSHNLINWYGINIVVKFHLFKPSTWFSRYVASIYCNSNMLTITRCVIFDSDQHYFDTCLFSFNAVPIAFFLKVWSIDLEDPNSIEKVVEELRQLSNKRKQLCF